MATTTATVRMPSATKRRLAAAARRQGLTLSRYLVESAEQAAVAAPLSGLGRELEKLALDGMAQLALTRVRHGQVRRWTEEDIVAEVKASRRERRGRA